MACPDEVELLGYLRERAAFPAVSAHVDGCDSCESLLVAFGELSSSRAPKGSVPVADGASEILPVEGDVLGRYEIDRQLGRGAMGMVYLARDPKLQRRVALKLLLQQQRSALEEARLLLEARAAARIQHANLVGVYDVGTWNGRVFLAMEYVDGPTLTRWLHAEPRERPAVLEVFKQIARGIVAAHTAGLVHCDIKPDNILIGAGGAKLGDFGLAMGPEHAGSAGARGTPMYMAPEVMNDEVPTAASDQFSFCVALLEALIIRRPKRRASPAGELFDASYFVSLPRWLVKLLTRGLSVAPSARFASMADVLAALERGTARRKRIVIVSSVVAAAAATGLTFAAMRSPTADPCPPPRAELASVWSPTEAQALAATFGADASRVTKRLDTYGDAWISSSLAVCRDTRVAHRYSEAILDRRTQCMERARSRIDATVSLLRAPSAKPLKSDDALRAIDNLPALAECNDVAALKDTPTLAPELRAQIVAWQTAIDIAMTMVDLRRPDDALAKLQALDGGIRAFAQTPDGRRLEANRYYVAGLALTLLDRPLDASAAFEQGYEAARAAANERLEVKIALEMSGLLAREPASRGDAKAWLGRGRAVAVRLDDLALTSMVAEAEGSLAYSSNDYPTALKAFGDAVATLSQLYTDDDLRTSLARQNLALALNKTGKSDAAREEVKKALTGLTNARGDSHPSLITMHNTLGNIEITVGNVKAARDAFTEARRRAAISKGETDRLVVMLDINLASLALREDDLAGARAGYERALASLEKSGGRGNNSWRGARQGLAQLASREKDFAGAQMIIEELITQRLADKVPDVMVIAALRIDLANALTGQDHADKAEEQLQLARAAYVTKLGENHAKTALVDLERADIAPPAKAEALVAPMMARTDLPPDIRARARWRGAKFTLAKDYVRARELATIGAKLAAEGGDHGLADEITAWVAKNTPEISVPGTKTAVVPTARRGSSK